MNLFLLPCCVNGGYGLALLIGPSMEKDDNTGPSSINLENNASIRRNCANIFERRRVAGGDVVWLVHLFVCKGTHAVVLQKPMMRCMSTQTKRSLGGLNSRP